MQTEKTTVTIHTANVGLASGTIAILRDRASRVRLAETEVRPFGFVAASCEAAEDLAKAKGWRVVKFQIVLVDSKGNVDAFAAGDPTPGRGANEFYTERAAKAAIRHLPSAGNGRHWRVREQPVLK